MMMVMMMMMTIIIIIIIIIFIIIIIIIINSLILFNSLAASEGGANVFEVTYFKGTVMSSKQSSSHFLELYEDHRSEGIST